MSVHDWTVMLSDPFGTVYAILDNLESMNLAVAVNQMGAWSIVLPGDFDVRLLRADSRIEFWYRNYLPAVGFLREKRIRESSGTRRITITGFDQNILLDRRIVAYYSSSAECAKTDYADDMMKAVVRENMGALATDTTRDWTATGLAVQADLSAGPMISRAFAWRNVLPILADLAKAAEANGTRVYYAVVPISPISFEFRTWINQPGQDRTSSGDNPLLLGTEYGNLDNAELDTDYSQMASLIYAAGQGVGAMRTVIEVYDPTAITSSPFGRIERFVDARESSTALQVEDAGRAALLAAQVRQRFTGIILDVPGCRFGTDWRLGDRVSASFAGQEFDCMIGAVEMQVDRNGSRISARLDRDVTRPRAIAVFNWSGS